MLEVVERSLISIKHRLQHHPTFLLFKGVNNSVAFVQPLVSMVMVYSLHLFRALWSQFKLRNGEQAKFWMSERRKLKQSLFEQIALLVFKGLRGMAPMYLQDRSFASEDPRTLYILPTQWRPGSSQGSSHLHGARPLETGHLLLQFPDSRTAVLMLSQKVTLLIILKGTCANMRRVCVLSILGRFWFQTLESKILDPLVTSFDTFQHRSTMLDDVGSVWPGLCGLMNRYWKYSNTETPI